MGIFVQVMISQSKITTLVEHLKEFSIVWVAEDGELVRVDHCRLTSFHGSGQTFNIMLLPSKEIRSVNRYTVIEFNGEEVIL